MRIVVCGTVIAAFAGLSVAPASAADADAAAFYRGRTVTIINAGGVGGGSGTYAQVAKPYLEKNLPGAPQIVQQYMPGAGGAKAANYLFTVAPRDGSVIGQPLQELVLWARLGASSARYDASQFRYLGGADVTRSTLTVMKSAGVASIEDARRKEIVMAAGGKGSQTYMYPAIANAILGTKFRIVTGYAGTGDMNLAIERGEAHGRAGQWASFKAARPQWIADKRLVNLAVVGPDPEPELPDVPLLSSLAKTLGDKAVLDLVSLTALLGRAWVAPPKVPADRIAALRLGFAAAFTDKTFIAEAGRRNLDLHPVTWQAQEAAAKTILATDQHAVDRLRQILEIK